MEKHGEHPGVILIAYYFPPNTAIAAARPHRFYTHLKRAGRRCEVITASEQGGGAAPDVHFVPDEVAPFWVSPRTGGLPLQGHVERLLRYGFPGSTGIAWSVAAARRCREILRRNPGRRFVVLATFPPVGVLFAALLARFPQRVPLIADFRDPLAQTGLPRHFLAPPSAACLRALVFRSADALIANTRQLAAQWQTAYPWTQSKVRVLWNGFDAENQPKARDIPVRPYRELVHPGQLYGGRNPNLIVQSLARLRKTETEVRDIRVVQVGPIGAGAGVDTDLCDRAVQEGWLDFRTQSIPRQAAVELTAEADFLLLLQPQSEVQVPGKLFEYLCIGRPIVAVVKRASATEYVLNNAGVPNVCIYPDDEPAVQDRKLLEILRLPSHPTPFNSWFERQFNAVDQAVQLASIIDEVAAPSR